jgi:hypothetical protein
MHHLWYSTYRSQQLLEQLIVLLDSKLEAFQVLNEHIIGPQPLYNDDVHVHTEVADARSRSRELKRNGMLYSTDYPLEHDQMLGEDSNLTGLTSMLTHSILLLLHISLHVRASSPVQ